MSVLAGKAAVVTGGSRGIGRAIVQRLARDGAAVVFGYGGNKAAAEETVQAVQAAGGTVWALQYDLAEPDAAEELMTEAEGLLGGLDILVNNAAVIRRLTALADTDPADFDHMLAVNARAPFLTMRYAARRMRDGGRIVNVSSATTAHPSPKVGTYVAGKGALEQLSAVAAKELGGRGITVNTLSPGATDTEMLRGANTDEILAAIPAMTPLGRLGEPADIADVVGFLAGPDGRWVTGQNLRATGGLG
ncbi:SDR family oxidoreductase [Kitasatospora sp. LaBMicrA B282]|uniref:SDR family oxidoreductase n=1 Tax=Kitasatospora sp. LaBMicrA B282 TaxID=3420949 RepID=UPI003D0A4DB1